MAIPILRINEILTEWASLTPPICDFTTENVMNAANIEFSSYAEVFNYLTRLDGYILIPSKIILCPNNHKGESYPLDAEIDFEEVYDCDCGEEDFPPTDFLIVFNFTKDFIEQSLKKNKQVTNREMTLV